LPAKHFLLKLTTLGMEVEKDLWENLWGCVSDLDRGIAAEIARKSE